jgi:DNA invertase Pin-like site-specific DNA recombinase
MKRSTPQQTMPMQAPTQSGAGERQAAIYLRVSTHEQDSTNQLPDCRQLAAARGLEVVEVYADDGMAGDAKKRPELERALLDAHQGHFKVVIAWSVDRISRDGATGLLKLLERLDAAGVRFISAREPYIDSAGPFRDVVVSLLGTFAKMEKTRLIERTLSGLRRAVSEGIRLGRPRVSDTRLREARRYVLDGHTVVAAARLARVSDSTLRRELRLRPLVKKGA